MTINWICCHHKIHGIYKVTAKCCIEFSGRFSSTFKRIELTNNSHQSFDTKTRCFCSDFKSHERSKAFISKFCKSIPLRSKISSNLTNWDMQLFGKFSQI